MVVVHSDAPMPTPTADTERIYEVYDALLDVCRRQHAHIHTHTRTRASNLAHRNGLKKEALPFLGEG